MERIAKEIVFSLRKLNTFVPIKLVKSKVIGMLSK